MIDIIISGMVVLIKEIGWTPNYIIWQLPCAYLMLIMDYWPVIKRKDKDGLEYDYENAVPGALEDIMRMQLEDL